MPEWVGHGVAVFMGFFAIMNPIANTPIFLSLTADADRKVKQMIAVKALVFTFLLIVAFCLLGKQIFHVFGFTMSAFRITGGLLVGLIGFNMLHGEKSKVHSPSDNDQKDSLQSELSIAISPLAMPILAGPGTIVTAMSFASTGGTEELIVTIIAFGLLCGITFICFLSSERIIKFMGQNGLNVVTRLMGLILASIGVQMLIQGIKAASNSG